MTKSKPWTDEETGFAMFVIVAIVIMALASIFWGQS